MPKFALLVAHEKLRRVTQRNSLFKKKSMQLTLDLDDDHYKITLLSVFQNNFRRVRNNSSTFYWKNFEIVVLHCNFYF